MDRDRSDETGSDESVEEAEHKWEAMESTVVGKVQ
jgi:hypothetical protein